MNFFDYAIVLGYLVALVGMGFMFRNQSTQEEYFLGGKTLGWKPLTLSVMATQLSAISFVSAPAFVGIRDGGGLKWLSYELAVPLAMILILTTVLPVLYRSGVVSIYDYLEKRFGRTSRILLSVIFQLSRAFSTGIMVYAVSIILQSTTGVDFWQSVVIIGIITILYSLQGGMKAVVYGDAIQMIVIVIGTILCIYFGLQYLGGIDVFLENVDRDRLQAVDYGSLGINGDGFGFLPMVFGGIVLYASYYGCDQTQAQRALSAKNTGDLKKMMIANAVLRFPVTILYCIAGLVIGTFAMTTPEFMSAIPLDNPDWMMPIFILNYMPHGIIGLLVVAILAAAMSSLSSTINSLAAVSVEDIYRLIGKETDGESYLNHAKYAAFFWGIITLVLSFYAGDIAPTVIEAINKVGSVFYGPILAMFIIATVDKRLTGLQVNVGLLAGVFANLLLWLNVTEVFWFWWNVVGLVVTVVVSYGTLLFIKTPRVKYEPEAEHSNTDSVSILTRKDIAILLFAFISMVLMTTAIPYLF